MFRFVFLLFCCFFLSGSLAKAQKYNFRNFSVNEGLSQSEIYSICEDRRGDLWLGSSGGGIIRFDGYSFKSFREEDGLVNNFVRGIIEDSKGILWIGTDKGVCSYEGRKFTFLDNPAGPGRRAIKSLLEDKDGNLWIGTATAGLYKVRNGRIENFSKSSGLPDNSINCLYLDKHKALWIGTNSGVTRYKNHQMMRFSGDDGLVPGNIRDITSDTKGNIWMVSNSTGVSCYNGSSFLNYTELSGLASDKVFSVFCDRKGRLWFGTAGGLSCYSNGSFTSYTENNGLGSNVVLCIREDTAHDLWFGTSGGGVSRLDNARFTHFMENERMGKQVFSLIQTLNGKMLFGTSGGGLTFFDGKNYFLLKGTEDFVSARVKALYYDRDSNLWIGTSSDGVYKFNNQGFSRDNRIDSLIGTSIHGFAMDTVGNMWFASPDSGICVIAKNGLLRVFNRIHGLLSDNVYTIVPDKKGNVWVGTDKGLNKISVYGSDSLMVGLSAYTQRDGLTNTSIGSIAIDPSGTVYLGTGGGGIFILKGKSFANISKRDGISSNNIYALVFDRRNHLWVGTESGVDRINLNENFEVKECRHFGKAEGFTGMEVYRNSCFLDRQGRVWFGTVNGASVYNPAEDIPFNEPPSLHLTGLKLFFDNIEKTQYADSVSNWYPVPESLVLPHNQNSLTFNFTGVYLRNPESVRYRWKLEGLDNDWSPALTQHEVTYSSLPPGEYTFMVISGNEYNVWSKEPVKFSFYIRPPFWKRWWFLLLVILSVTGGIWYYFQSRLEKNRIERERLEMEKNLMELEQEASRLQMNPHFIFNALNSIQGFISTNEASQAKKYLHKFARLMRLILENAREKFIPLQNEVEILDNYLELERLCKNNKFDYKITLANDLDSSSIEIPPMMIQPFVENAIVHGIKNKEEQGLIEILFRIDHSTLICEVTDNGIGRKKAAEIKAKYNVGHKSTAMSVTQKRLEQLQSMSGEPAGFEIKDLTNGEGLVMGTKVIIKIPVEV
jgi:ligand-binding sensor domain-containing protein